MQLTKKHYKIVDKCTQIKYNIKTSTQFAYFGGFMEISELRIFLKMSQRQFAMYFGIPIGTLRNWEQGISKPPEYVYNMLLASIRRDKMINIETIKFVRLLNELAEMSSNGIETFEKANQDNYREKIFYDEKSNDGRNGYRVVADACLIDDPKCYHHDIISYFDDMSNEYDIKVIIDEDGIPYVNIAFIKSEEEIVIENGVWYFV